MMKGRRLEFVILLLVALGAGPAFANIWLWSTTASNNGSIDPSINFSEGMAPSAVNDSARAMMAAIASFRNDISGVNTTGGTPTAYTLVTSEGVATTPVAGQMIGFIANATNGPSPSLTVDGGNTYPIWLNGSPVGAASMIANTPYRVSFDATDGAWLLEGGLASPYSVPLGAFLASTAPSPPNSNFILPFGQCISTTTYAAYWAMMGSPASGTCAGGQFRVIDMRGRIPVPLDNLGGTAAGRMTSSAAGCGSALTSMGVVCANGSESRALSAGQIPTITSGGSASVSGALTAMTFLQDSSYAAGGIGIHLSQNTSIGFSASGSASVTSNNTGGGAHSIVPPTIGVNFFLRVL